VKARVPLVLLVGLALPALVAAQGLGDAAAREREKRVREKKPATAQVYTNDDLEAGRPPESEGEGESSDGGSSSSSESGGGESSSRAGREEREPLPDRLAADRPYIEAVRTAQSEVASIEDQIRQANARLNPMSTDYIYGASGSNDPNEELRLRQELTELQARLVDARRAVATANEALRSHREGRPISGSFEE